MSGFGRARRAGQSTGGSAHGPPRRTQSTVPDRESSTEAFREGQDHSVMYIASRIHNDEGTLFGIIFALVVMVLLGICSLIYRAGEQKREHERLRMVSDKYTGEIASLISQKMFWRGQTAEQLIDSLGSPDAIDVKLLKTRRREIWKFGHYEANRYRTRVTLDNGIVTTWTTH